jgi:hypothetical protein
MLFECLTFVFVLLTQTFLVVNETGVNVRASWLPSQRTDR